MQNIGNVNFTTTEALTNVANDYQGPANIVNIQSDVDVYISTNDNSNYQKYDGGKIYSVPGPIVGIYVKGVSVSGNLRYWCFR